MSLKSRTAITYAGIAVAAIATLAVVLPARATDYTNSNPLACPSGVGMIGVALDAVGGTVEAGVFVRFADQSNLLVKLSNANSKTLLAKWGDAIDKLQDISDKATELAGAPKPKLNSADGINAAVGAAIACLTFPSQRP